MKKPEFFRDPIFQQYGNPYPLRRPLLTAEPSIIKRNLKPEDLFLIFASDGLWEQLSDEAAVEIVYKNPRAVSSHFNLIFTRVVIFGRISHFNGAFQLSCKLDYLPAGALYSIVDAFV